MNDDLKKLENYLLEKYDVIELDSSVKSKLFNLFKNDKRVTPEHLLKLFQIMESILKKIRVQNIAKGKKIEGNMLLKYDLTIILNYYPQYIKKINEIEKQEKDVHDMRDFTNMISNVKSQPPKHEFSDVSELVNEMFF